MTPEIISVIAVGVALAGIVLISIRGLRGEIAAVRGETAVLRGEMAELRNPMARIEGMFEGFLRREPEPAAAE